MKCREISMGTSIYTIQCSFIIIIYGKKTLMTRWSVDLVLGHLVSIWIPNFGIHEICHPTNMAKLQTLETRKTLKSHGSFCSTLYHYRWGFQ
jgi:hypothetical protein